jgi:ribosome maturation factor RimP
VTQQSERLVAVLEPVVADLGLQLYDVEVTGSGRARTLRILVDRDGGVDLDAITAANDALAPLLDRHPMVAAAFPGPYVLEVSSPGVERPLRTPAHFRGAVGAAVSLKTRDAEGRSARRHVTLVGADDDGVEIEADGARERVEYADIVQARTVFEWAPAPKPGKPVKSKLAVPAHG